MSVSLGTFIRERRQELGLSQKALVADGGPQCSETRPRIVVDE